MKNTLYTYVLSIVFMSSSFLHAAFDGNYVFSLETLTQTQIDNNITNPQKGMIVYNTTDNQVYEHNSTQWVKINAGASIYTGFFIINASGNKVISGLPFKPSQITFVGHANIGSLNLNTDNGTGNNNTGISNSFGSMNGFARENSGGTITQQIIYVGGSGNSINDISRYASSSNCIGIRYGNQNGDNLGVLSATLNSFNADGFTINVTRTSNATNESLVVLYTAYR